MVETLIRGAAFTCLLPLGIGIIRWQKQGKVGRLLLAVLILTGMTEALNFYLRAEGLERDPIVHLYIGLEFTLFSTMYGELLGQKKWSWGLCGLFGAIGIGFEIWVAGPWTYPAQLRNLESGFVILLALTWLIQRLILLPPSKLRKETGFWVSSAHLAYFASTFMVFNLVPYLSERPEEYLLKVWVFHGFMLLILYFGYSMALLNPHSAWKKSSPSSGPAA